MNKKLFAKLSLNYGKEPNEDLYELWDYNLRCYDDEEIEKAFNLIMSKDKYFPSLNRILEVIKGIKTNPKWLENEIKNEPTDEETSEIFEDFNNFIKEFRND